MNKDDIFSTDTSDLPDLIKREIPKALDRGKSAAVIELIQIAGRPCSTTDITIGLFRKFGVMKKRVSIRMLLHYMVKCKKLIRPSRGFYDISKLSKGLK